MICICFARFASFVDLHLSFVSIACLSRFFENQTTQDSKLGISVAFRLVVFGGRGADRKRLNDVHFLDVATWTWHRPTTDGMPPTPRFGAVAVFMGGQMIIFGGYGAGARLNDLHVLDLTSWQWQQPAFTGTAPSPRQSPGIALQGQLQATYICALRHTACGVANAEYQR